MSRGITLYDLFLDFNSLPNVIHTRRSRLFSVLPLCSAKVMFFSFQDFCYFHFTDQFLSCSELDLEQFPLERLCFVVLDRIARAQTLKPKGRSRDSCPSTLHLCDLRGVTILFLFQLPQLHRMGCRDRCVYLHRGVEDQISSDMSFANSVTGT